MVIVTENDSDDELMKPVEASKSFIILVPNNFITALKSNLFPINFQKYIQIALHTR